MRKILSYMCIFLLLCSNVSWAANYYYAQSAAGLEDGSDCDNALPISDFDNDSFSGDDNVYFCGEITDHITLKLGSASGTQGHPITFQCAAGGCEFSYDGSYYTIRSNANDWITYDGLTIHGSKGGIGIGGTTGATVKNCTIYQTAETGIKGTTVSYATIGGASGDGNTIYNIGTGTEAADILLHGLTDGIISYNKCYANDTNYGIDGITIKYSNNVLIEYNIVYDHQKSVSPKGEDGIDLKQNNYNVIVRYNYTHGNRQAGLCAQMGSHNVYFYGNLDHGSGWAGMYILRGVDGDDNMHDIYVWSNIIYESLSGTYVASSASGTGSSLSLDEVYILNNTFAENGGTGSTQRAGVGFGMGTGHICKNNIFYKNHGLSGGNTYEQLYTVDSTNAGCDYNYYYYPETSGQNLFTIDESEKTLAQWQAAPYNQGANSVESNPGMNDPENHDYKLTGAIPGTDLSECFGVTIQGTLYTICVDDALDPDNTNFAAEPLEVATVKRDTYGWNVGAWALLEADETPPVISGASPSGEQVCGSDPRNVTMSWNTDETANCRISDTDEGDYDLMPADSVTNTDSTSHSDTESLACDSSYNRYVYCEDPSGNEAGPTTISFSIEAGAPPDPPAGTVGNITGGSCQGGSM